MDKKMEKKIQNNAKSGGEKKKYRHEKVEEERFTKALDNPIFRRLPKREKKVVIDKRFQSMFDSEKFKLTYKVDKRGKPELTSTDENLKKYYHLDSEEEDQESENETKIKIESDSEDDEGENDDVEGNLKENEMGKEIGGKMSEVERKKLKNLNIDYARGEMSFQNESSDSSSTESEDEEEVNHEWGELDRDAPRTEEATKRLALCNMDWDRLTAIDLMVLFNSFLPPGGIIKCVTIYPSEFGKERMAEEDLHGPKELVEKEESGDEDEDIGNRLMKLAGENEDEEGSSYQMEKLRRYQLNRLKYYYAVLDFDCKETAEKVYSECDGMEFESSSTRVDLRFIPDDMTFDDTPKDKCDAVPEKDKYRPKFFTTTALQQVKVDLTWDETDPSRQQLTDRLFNPKENVTDDDLRAYLASSDSEESGVEDLDENEEDDKSSAQDPITKYRSLLESIEKSERDKKDKDVELEISWGVGLKEKTTELVKKKMKEESGKGLTPWEEMLEKKKEKKKLAKRDKKKGGEESDSSLASDQPFSDDDVDVDMNDPFFKEELEKSGVKLKKKKDKIEKKGTIEKDEISEENKAELELLLMEDADDKKHFSLKKIIENESSLKSKKKKQKKKKEPKKQEIDGFKVDVEDKRFSALFNSHHFNLDPSDPNFKKTKAMDAIISEKQKRRNELAVAQPEIILKETDNGVTETQTNSTKGEISYLVKSIKRKTATSIDNRKKLKKHK